MAEVFSCSWVACLDESMSLWLNRWTCPGWIFVPRKPWSMGNEYHSMCCGMTSIMFAIDLVEGSDRPKELPSLDPDKKGPTVSLLLRMCKPLYTKGTIVILDSGFCVLKGIVELMKKGVYTGAVMRKFLKCDSRRCNFPNVTVTGIVCDKSLHCAHIRVCVHNFSIFQQFSFKYTIINCS